MIMTLLFLYCHTGQILLIQLINLYFEILIGEAFKISLYFRNIKLYERNVHGFSVLVYNNRQVNISPDLEDSRGCMRERDKPLNLKSIRVLFSDSKYNSLYRSNIMLFAVNLYDKAENISTNKAERKQYHNMH